MMCKMSEQKMCGKWAFVSIFIYFHQPTSETQAIASSKIKLQSEKEWEHCPNFNRLYIYVIIAEEKLLKIAPFSILTQLPHLTLAGL